MQIKTVLLVHFHYILKVKIKKVSVYEDSILHLKLYKPQKKLIQNELAFIIAIFKES
jgi:hypothetical protein